MLRLHPSELTLTPADVDETFRRIALRQTSRAQQHWTMPPAGQPGQSGRPNRPILRRGPQRLVRHATTISNIPLLQPQQAVITSVDQDDNHEPHQEAAHLPHSTHQRNGATVGSPAALPAHAMQLPLRFRSHFQTVDVQAIPTEQTEGSTSLSPSNHPPRPARVASARNVDNGSEQRAQLPSVDSSANTLGLRGGGLASVARPHNVTQDTIHTPSPLNHIQRLSSRSGRGLASLARASEVAQDPIHASSPLGQTQRPTSPTQLVSRGDAPKPQSNPNTDHTTPHLKKCSAETAQSNCCPCRTYNYPSSSEPRRGNGRHPPTGRSRSSGEVTSSSVLCPSISILEDASRHDQGPSNLHSEEGDASSARQFSSAIEGLGQFDQTSSRVRERGSGATNASAAYSWYGSLGSDTQFPGSQDSPKDECCPQLDGVRASTHRISPLPSLPYTRTLHGSTASSPPSVQSRQLSDDHVVATTAGGYDSQSLADAQVEQYQGRQQTSHSVLNFATHANATIPNVGGLPIDGPNQERDMPSGNSARLGSGPRHGTGRQLPPSERGTYELRNFSRISEYPRVDQRSSENDAVSAPIPQGDRARHGRVEMQRAVYERLQNAVYTTHAGAARDIELVQSPDSAPRRNPPHDVSNQGRSHMADDGEGFDLGSSVGVHPGHTHHAVDAGAWRRLPSQFSRQHGAESTRHPSLRVYDGGSGAPRRDGPLSTLLSFEAGMDTTDRPWQSPLVRGVPTTMLRMHGRVRGEQRDQENAGDEALMRREEANVIARYGEEEQQRMMMNETPPRIGRIERRMME